MKQKKFIPSKYQEAIFDYVRTNTGNILVNAAAGSGKSTTLIKCVDLIPDSKKILFCAFNKDIVSELQEKIGNKPNIDVKTIHSIGLSMLWRNFKSKGYGLTINEFKYSSYFLTHTKGLIDSTQVDDLSQNDKEKYKENILSLIQLARLTLCQTEDSISELAKKYCFDLVADEPSVIIKMMEWGKGELNTIDYTDMVWLPVELKIPAYGLLYDWVLVDECQDMNVCQREIVQKCKKLGTRYIYVGDPSQCQPRGSKILMWDGSEKNIEDIKVGDQVVTYHRRWGKFVGLRRGNYGSPSRYGIIDGISKRITDKTITVVGENGYRSTYTPEHICYAKLNKEATIDTYVLYLMCDDYNRFRIGKAKTYVNNGDCCGLKNRMRNEKCRKAWILNFYQTNKEARMAEILYSCMFGIPQVIFQQERAGATLISDSDVFNLYKQLGNIGDRVIKCLKYFHLDINYPIAIYDGKYNHISKEHMFEINACNLVPKYMDLCYFEETTVPRTHGKNQCVEKRIPIRYSNIKEINRSDKEVEVFSLEVRGTHNYVSDGILTHNCLYSFAGSDVESFYKIKNIPNTIELPLSVSYRCADKIVEFSRRYSPNIEKNEDNRIGEIIYEAPLKCLKDGDMVLCRNNAPLSKLYAILLKDKKKAYIRGKDIGDNLVKYIESFKAEDINQDLSKDGLFVRMYDDLFKTRNKIAKKYRISEKEAIGSSQVQYILDQINTIEALCEGINKTSTLCKMIKKIFSNDKKEGISLSTIHKAKGLESDRVFVLCDSLMPSKLATQKWEMEQEKNLMYVAYTRAKNTLGFLQEDKFKHMNTTSLDKEESILNRIESITNRILGKKKEIINNEANVKHIVTKAKSLTLGEINKVVDYDSSTTHSATTVGFGTIIKAKRKRKV